MSRVYGALAALRRAIASSLSCWSSRLFHQNVELAAGEALAEGFGAAAMPQAVSAASGSVQLQFAQVDLSSVSARVCLEVVGF